MLLPQWIMLENISKLKYNRAYEAIYKQAHIKEHYHSFRKMSERFPWARNLFA
jgi:hypothetical protein